jgi:hypothetical protein
MACTETDEFARGMHPTGGLRPPLLIGARPLAGEKTPFAMHERILPGAAGVSPPWFASRVCNGDRLSREARFDRGPGSHELQSRIAIDQRQSSVNRSGGRQPAVVRKPRLQRRPCIAGGTPAVDPARTAKTKSLVRGERRRTRAAGVSPPWLANRACNGDRVSRGLMAFLAHDRHQATTGAYANRLIGRRIRLHRRSSPVLGPTGG